LIQREGGTSMEDNKPFIHQFSTHRSDYVYDVNTNEILIINKECAKALNSIQKGEANVQAIDNNSHLSKIKANGYLSSHKFSEIIHPEDELLEFRLNSKLNMVILQVTQQCNLRCSYCPYSGGYYNREHANKKMDFETAKKAIDFYINRCLDREEISVSFYGGEPLLEFELIKKCIDYVEREAEGKKVFFNMTSNATLLTPEIVQYMQKHNIDLMISLDGPQKVHDKNRDFCGGKGTFETVIEKLEMVKNQFPDFFKTITFNCVMDLDNDFGCINEFFTSYDVIKDSNVNFSSLNDDHAKDKRDVNKEDYVAEYNYELFKLFLSKIGRLDENNVSKMVIGYYRNLQTKIFQERHTEGQRDKGHPGGPCVPGAQRLFVDIYGNLYPCERVNESSKAMRIGHIDNGFNMDKARKILNIGKLTEESCKNCWAYRFCSLCASAADDLTELSAERKSERCRGVKAGIDRMMKDYCILKENGDSFESIKLVDYI
jgi:uncharacterized protein